MIALNRRLALISGSLALLTLPACTGGSGAGPKQVRIVVGGTEVGGKYQPGGLSSIVDSDGWLKEQLAAEGYSLQFVDMPHAIGGPMINEGFVNKTVEFAHYGDLPAVIGAGAGAPVRLVVPSNGGAISYVVVPVNSPAKSVSDLKGLRVALHRGRPWEAVFARLSDSAGLKIDDYKIYNVNPSAGAAALAAGKVDAFVGPVADAHRLVAEGVGRVLWSTYDGPPSWAQRTELFGRGDFIDENPKIAQLVAAAYLKAGYWASKDENRDAYIAIMSRETPESVVRAELDKGGPWKERFSPIANAGAEDHYRFVIDYAAATGLISQKPDVGPLIDTSLVQPGLQMAQIGDYWTNTAVASTDSGTVAE